MANGIRIGGVAPYSVSGAEAVQRYLESYPPTVVAAIRSALEGGADDLVGILKQTAPVSELESHPGELRDSVHRENGRHDLSIRVVVDARDAKGRIYAPHVEYGHKTPDGGHVAPHPFFWPAVRVFRKKLIADIRRKVRAAAKKDGA